MRVLITGGAGFIGSHLAEACVAEGHEVTVFDNLSRGHLAQVPPAAAFFQGDLTCPGEIALALRQSRPQAVLHLAAQMNVRYSVQEPAFDAQVNILGGLNLLTEARRHGVQRLVFASSGGALYGEADTLPTPESAPARPLSPYGVTKATFEQYLRITHTLHGLPCVILRYANVYGPRQSVEGEAGVVTVFARRLRQGEACTLYGDGTATRDYVYVEDVVRANLLALSRGTGETVNIGTGVQTGVRQVFQAVSQATERRVPLRERPARAGEVGRSALCPRRALEVLGWRAEIPFAEGVRRTVASLEEPLLQGVH